MRPISTLDPHRDMTGRMSRNHAGKNTEGAKTETKEVWRARKKVLDEGWQVDFLTCRSMGPRGGVVVKVFRKVEEYLRRRRQTRRRRPWVIEKWIVGNQRPIQAVYASRDTDIGSMYT
jgi:hypothetical protein